MTSSRVAVVGSERAPVDGAKVIGVPNPSERIHVTVVVRRKEELPPLGKSVQIMSHDDLVAGHGATANDLLQVREFAKQFHLQIIAESAAKRTVSLAGTIADFGRAFDVTFDNVQLGGHVIRQRVGRITVPSELGSIIEAVMGLDNRPQARPRSRIADPGSLRSHAGVHPLSPLDVAKLYNFPAGDGSGQTIAIIELGGGFAQDDLNTYFHELGLSVPSVTAVSILNQGNNPGVDPKADGETMLDIEVAGAVAPGAHQRVYFAPNTDQGFLAAIKAAIHDNPSSMPCAISISYGGPESAWTAQAMNAFDSAFQDAANLGIPVCVASGDDGSSDGESGLNVDFPASAPHALGCGGTLLQGSGAVISSEVVWNGGSAGGGTGGGVSRAFHKPSYQASVAVPAPAVPAGGRGVPDVSGNAADGSPYKVRISGADTVAWGTSAVAPLWSGLIARLTQSLGHPVGFLQPLIYQSTVESAAFFDITQGNNDTSGGGGPFNAGTGWDACTGLGTPDGVALLNALKSVVPPPHPPTPHPPTPPTPHPPTPPTPHPPHPPTPPTPHPPHPPTPHPPHPPTPHPPHPPTPPTPHPGSGGTGSTGAIGGLGQFPQFEFPERSPQPVTQYEQPPTQQAMVAPAGRSNANAIAIVGVVGIVGVLATVAVVGTVAIAKDK